MPFLPAGLFRRLDHLLLGRSGRRRGHAKLTLLALLVYLLFSVVVAGQVHLGLMEPGPSAWLCGVSLAGITGFYLLVRTGHRAGLGRDPSLTFAQSVFGIAITAWGYAIDPPLRGAVMAIMLLNLVWGMFVLPRRQMQLLAALALALLGGVMLWRALTDPQRFPPVIEGFHFLFCVVLIGAMSTLSIQMGRLRRKLSTRKMELQSALQRIHQLATRDDLTGLVNRRHLRELMLAETLRHQRNGRPMSLALVDLDHFKHINDTHGHAAGDQVLQLFAEAAQSVLRETDVLGRWGGEEFLLMLPETRTADAMDCLARLREVLDHAPLNDIAPGLRVTFSAGLSTAEAGEPLQTLIERGDRAMYRAKQQGRNCTVVG